ncbi:helix-turn-helix domain-containing protein [Labrenzia sp. PHM005]|uniref:winged helix-turn-helix transcriptional regulator n=1 Tax=Labrenzia sp. PHM005 TaxID=2590016 RepID=UPI00210FA2B9|nr:helix-turn-helix domain-containing protein [Labrenzia sp. PHM005]
MLSKIAGKWSMLVIDALDGTPKRNGQLMRQIEGISQKMLTQTLKELEEMQIVVRHDMQSVPPHVEYCLTPLGNGLRKRICALDRWVENNMLDLIAEHRSIPLVVTD